MHRFGARRAIVAWASALAILACGCASSDAPPATCSTGRGWTSGDEASPLMYPGGDCIGCHANQGDEAPRFEVAGTVMGAYHDDDDCDGVAGVLVHVTGADGVTVDLETNPNGNFYRTIGEGDPIMTPFSVVIERAGRKRAMTMKQSTKDCASCHTSEGANAAPGRILAP